MPMPVLLAAPSRSAPNAVSSHVYFLRNYALVSSNIPSLFRNTYRFGAIVILLNELVYTFAGLCDASVDSKPYKQARQRTFKATVAIARS